MSYIIFKVRYHSAKAPKLVCFINLWIWSVSAFHKTSSFLTAPSQSHLICKIDFLKGRWKKESNSFLKAIIIFQNTKKRSHAWLPNAICIALIKFYIHIPIYIQFLMLCLIVTPCSGYPRIVLITCTIFCICLHEIFRIDFKIHRIIFFSFANNHT